MTGTPSTRNGAVRVRLAVSNTQARQLLAAAGARRYAYNWALARIVANHAQWQAEASYDIVKKGRTRPLSFFDLVKAWDGVKREQAPWFAEHSTWTFRYAIRAAARAHADFLAGKTRFPRFKARHRDRPRFTVTGSIKLEAGRVRVAKYGWFRIAAPCKAQARLRRLLTRKRARLVNVTVTRHTDGRWYATFCYEQTIRPRTQTDVGPSRTSMPAVGVDLGVKTAAVAATADGAVVAELAASRALRDALRKVKHLQRDFSRTQKGSSNRRKAADRLARAHAKVAARRAGALHVFTARLARNHPVIGLEDLAVVNMLRNRHLAAAISDQGWGELRRQLDYKTERHGGTLVVADRWYPSTKTCSSCGTVKAKLSLAVRIYTCDSCGLVLDRDVNAAANLAAWAEHAQAGDRHPGGPTAENTRHARGGDNEPAHHSGVLAGVSGEAGTSQLAVTGAA